MGPTHAAASGARAYASRGSKPPRARALAILWLASLGCAGPDEGPWSEGRTLIGSLNRFYARHVSGYDPAFVRARVEALCAQVEARAEEINEEAIGRVLFGPEGMLQYAPNSQGEILFCPQVVLSRGRGNCLGLATVFLMVAESLGIEASAVLQPKPGHVVVASSRGCWDPTQQFRPVDPGARAVWATVGRHGWYGTALPRERLVAEHITTVATVLPANDIHGMDGLYRMAYAADETNPSANRGLALAAILRSDWAGAERHARMAYESNPASEFSCDLMKAVTEHGKPAVSAPGK